MVALIWTLNLQRRAGEYQAKAVQIEEDRDRRQLLPILILENPQMQGWDGQESQVRVKLDRGNARNFILGPLENQAIDFRRFYPRDLLKQNEVMPITYIIKKKGRINTDSRIGPLNVPAAKAYFYDEGNRAYQQIIYTNGEVLYITLPEQLENDAIKKIIFNFEDFK